MSSKRCAFLACLSLAVLTLAAACRDTIPGRDDNGIINIDFDGESSDTVDSATQDNDGNGSNEGDGGATPTDPEDSTDGSTVNDSNDTDTPPDDTPDNVPALIDTDGDGFPDDEETNAIPSSDPLNPLDTPLNPIDSDGDGCSDFDELNFDESCDNNPTTTDSGDGDASFIHSLSTARHVDKPFTEAEVDSIYISASSLLQTVETECPDIATDTTFARSGSMTTFDTASAVITTESQLDLLFDLPQDIKIVDAMIGVCGLPPDDEVSILLGCAIEAGSLVIIGDAEPDVWAHEWGHVQGLPHRDNCPRNIMHSFEIETNAVNETERSAFLSSTPLARVFHSGVANAPPVIPDTYRLARTRSEPLADWLTRVACKSYLSGVPGSVIAGLDSSATPHLTKMLSDPANESYRHNIIRMIGFTGDSTASARLIASISADTGEISHSRFAAMAESFLALGRLASHDNTNAALGWLIDGTNPKSWANQAVTWSYRSFSGQNRDHLLARLSVMALGVSKDQQALEHLRELALPGAESDGLLAEQVHQAITRLEGKLPLARSLIGARRYR